MKLNFDKYTDGLIPAIIQDSNTGDVLMLGFMDKAALKKTRKSGLVTFYSRSRQQLWTKGETSGNRLQVKEILPDCDADTLLIKAEPAGPVCHNGTDTCFGESNEPTNFLFKLESIIKTRKTNPVTNSNTSRLFAKGLNKIAQKVGEEAVELIIESKDQNDDLFKAEAADLLYHFLVLCVEKNIEFRDILETLEQRSK
jgi:phosphoribosyl-AMP cyclohydrolase / phosphoribosyl-ATP pyrophosphohydrolase